MQAKLIVRKRHFKDAVPGARGYEKELLRNSSFLFAQKKLFGTDDGLDFLSTILVS